MNRLAQQYQSTVIPKLAAALQRSNVHALPRITKVVVNAGLGKTIQEPAMQEAVLSVIRRVTGQQPIKTLARKSISNFKVRKGMVIGAKVTMRGSQMYEFLDKLVSVTLPRLRDFRGLSRRSFDGSGNYSIGFSEHIVFPEIASDEVEKIVGLEVNIVTTATTDNDALQLLTMLGFPFKKEVDDNVDNT